MSTPAAVALVTALQERSLSLAVAESLTGGAVSAAIVDVPGASAVFRGGVVAYATELKAGLLGVDEQHLAAHGPVDPIVAEQMAEGVRQRLGVNGRPASIGIATTGVAGPEAQGGKPVGTVFVGVATARGIRSRRFEFSGDRSDIRRASVEAALILALEATAE